MQIIKMFKVCRSINKSVLIYNEQNVRNKIYTNSANWIFVEYLVKWLEHLCEMIDFASPE